MHRAGERVIHLKSDLGEITRLTDFIHEFGREENLPEDVVFNLTLCLEELAVNTISYGYGECCDKTFPVHMWMEEGSVCVRLQDDAEEFDPLKAPEFNIETAMAQERIGGLGITLVRRLMDVFKYERRDGWNIIHLRKTVFPAKAAV